MSAAVIELDSAGFRFGERWIYRDVSFALARGEIAAVLGPNGRGKTTLLKTVCGLLPPLEGEVRVRGRLGYVPQSAFAAFSYSVLDIVLMGRARHVRLFRVPSAQDFEIARQAIASLGLSDMSERLFNQLSGGERQLVLIARALASECDLLVLDEPVAALDFHNQGLILETLREISLQRGLTVLMSTHYPQHALHLAHKVLLMHGPDRYQFGASDEILSETNLRELYSVPIRKVDIEHDCRISTTLVPIFARDPLY